jgi:hypothetical protein
MLAATASSLVVLNPGSPTQVMVGIPAYDNSAYALDYVNSATAEPLTLTLADTYGNPVTASASGTVTFTVVAGTLSTTTGTVTAGGLTTTVDYTPITSAGAWLAYGTYDLISASLVVPSGTLAGTYLGSSKDLSIGFLGSGLPLSTPSVIRYLPSVGGSPASGAGNAVAGSTVELSFTVPGALPQKNVPVNFSLTTTISGTPYTGTFSNGLTWIVVPTNSLGVAAANFTADTTATPTAHAAYAMATVSEPYSTISAYEPTNTASTARTGTITTIPSTGIRLVVITYSDIYLSHPTSYVKPLGNLYLDVELQDQYGNLVTWTNSYVLQIGLTFTAGGLSATTVYIKSGFTDIYASGFQDQFTAPTTLGNVVISASTPQTGISGTSKTVDVVGITPLVYITAPTTTSSTTKSQTIAGYAIPSPAYSAGSVGILSFTYSLNGAANVTTSITSTNSTGAKFFSFAVTMVSGSNTVKVYATDSVGNVGMASLTFSTLPPVTFATSLLVQGTPVKATIGGYTGISANYTNAWSASQNVIVFAVWKNALGQTVAVSTGGLTLASGATGTAFAPLQSALPSGPYTVNIFVVTTGNLPVSITTTVSVTV